MTREIPNLVKRGDRWRYRRTVPADVRPLIGKCEWVSTFRPDTPMATVLTKVDGLRLQHDALIGRARSGEILSKKEIAEAEATARSWLSGDKSQLHEMIAFWENEREGGFLLPEVAAMLNAIEHGGTYQPDRTTLSAAYNRDVKLHAREGRDETPFKVALNSFIDNAEDADPREITREQVVRWIRHMQKRVAPATVRRRLGALRAVVNRFYEDHDVSRRNPFSGHKVGGAGSAADRVPFNKAMLKAIDKYLKESKRLRPEIRNMVTLMKLTGGGTAEIGGLTVADVFLDPDVPYIHIRPNAVRGVKAASRDRRIPLLPKAREAAQDAVQRAKAANKGKRAETISLFPWTSAGAEGMSARINKAIRAAGVPKSPRLSAYSFRHTLKQALQDARVPDYIERRIMGHAAKDVHGDYGALRKRLPAKLEALEAALPHLGDIDASEYRSGESLNVK